MELDGEGEIKFSNPADLIFKTSNSKTLLTICGATGEIKFSLDNFPDYTPSDFAKEFIKILEECFCLKFEDKRDGSN